ncbi:SAVED domain-containing protein [Nocardia salmonicida]|uniref:SAVED domain-containing protein n=1 Tax=Nocardia salmonicida TaxID=53431 RepID=UPI0037BA087B
MLPLIKDGTVVITAGSMITGGFLVESAKSIMAGETAGRTWFYIAFAVGVLLVVVGFVWRWSTQRRTQVGIVVVAADTPSLARMREQQAEDFSTNEYVLTLKAAIDLPVDTARRVELMTQLVEETQHAIATADRLTPHAARVNVIATMRLHIAFWFGARIGHTHSRETAIFSLRQGNGTPAFFHATSLRTEQRRARSRLDVAVLETIAGGDSTRVALALDLQNFGDSFRDRVLDDCRARGFGALLMLRNPNETLPENKAVFTDVVDQVCRVWRETQLPAGARSGQHAIYLSGPVSIALALGARLAAADQGRWTPLSYNTVTGTYESFPPAPQPTP